MQNVQSQSAWEVQCIVLYCGRVPAANATGSTAAEGLLYKLAPPDVSTRDPSSERRNYLGEKWPINFA